ncbi:MAG: hypothetical protein JNM14_01820 [Ferruginibacter sp.]|nr:hypothetical protein [Ferruginibacter sp.]
MKQLITLVFISCVLFSCKKSSGEDEYYTVTGIVLDFDSHTPISDAKVYVKVFTTITVLDSAVSDANGKVSFRFKNDGRHMTLHPAKPALLNPVYLYLSYIDEKDRTDTLYLARPSFVNFTSHKTGIYLATDTVNIQVQNDYIEPTGIQYSHPRTIYKGPANVADKTFNLQTIYGHNIGSFFFGATKMYFGCEIIRNGGVIAAISDSTNIIRFGTQNFTLNY